MLRKVSLIMFVVVLSLLVAVPAFAGGPPPGKPGGDRVRVVVYVTSQDLYYDSIVGPDLPPHGPFQLLETGPKGLQTEFGPGDKGYVGGRWKMADGQGYKYFSCPLLGPGREEP
jgi:hypothetical protein